MQLELVIAVFPMTLVLQFWHLFAKRQAFPCVFFEDSIANTSNEVEINFISRRSEPKVCPGRGLRGDLPGAYSCHTSYSLLLLPPTLATSRRTELSSYPRDLL
jgi:hypothetical protein